MYVCVEGVLPHNCVHGSWSEYNSAWNGPAPENFCASFLPVKKMHLNFIQMAFRQTCFVCTFKSVRACVWLTVFCIFSVCLRLYLYSHLLGLLLYLLDDLIASTAIVASCWWAMLLPLFQTDPAEVILTLQKETESRFFLQKIIKCKYTSQWPALIIYTNDDTQLTERLTCIPWHTAYGCSPHSSEWATCSWHTVWSWSTATGS